MEDTGITVFMISNRATINLIKNPAILFNAIVKTTWHQTSTGLIKCHAQGHIYLGTDTGMCPVPVYYSPYTQHNILTLKTLVDYKLIDGNAISSNSKHTIAALAADPNLEISESEMEPAVTPHNPHAWFERKQLVSQDKVKCAAAESNQHKTHVLPLTVEEYEGTFCVDDMTISEPVEGQTNPLLIHKSCVYPTA